MVIIEIALTQQLILSALEQGPYNRPYLLVELLKKDEERLRVPDEAGAVLVLGSNLSLVT